MQAVATTLNFLQALGEGMNRRIASHGIVGGHIERGSDVGSSAADVALAAREAAVAVHRRHADQCGNFLSVELAQFRKIDHQLVGDVVPLIVEG